MAVLQLRSCASSALPADGFGHAVRQACPPPRWCCRMRASRSCRWQSPLRRRRRRLRSLRPARRRQWRFRRPLAACPRGWLARFAPWRRCSLYRWRASAVRHHMPTCHREKRCGGFVSEAMASSACKGGKPTWVLSTLAVLHILSLARLCSAGSLHKATSANALRPRVGVHQAMPVCLL